MAQFKASVCKVCGATIFSKHGKAELCINKSSCRVKWSRQQKKARKEAESLTITMEQYMLYEAVSKVNPMIASALSQMLKLHGKEAFALMLHSMVYILKVGTQDHV